VWTAPKNPRKSRMNIGEVGAFTLCSCLSELGVSVWRKHQARRRTSRKQSRRLRTCARNTINGRHPLQRAVDGFTACGQSGIRGPARHPRGLVDRSELPAYDPDRLCRKVLLEWNTLPVASASKRMAATHFNEPIRLMTQGNMRTGSVRPFCHLCHHAASPAQLVAGSYAGVRATRGLRELRDHQRRCHAELAGARERIGGDIPGRVQPCRGCRWAHTVTPSRIELRMIADDQVAMAGWRLSASERPAIFARAPGNDKALAASRNHPLSY
jgi:hypothetical protein